MLRKFGNYLAIIALSLGVGVNSATASAGGVYSTAKARNFAVDTNKDFIFQSEFIAGGGSHSYNLKVASGKKVRLKIRAAHNVSLQVQSSDGSIQKVPANKFFEVKLKKEGQYVVQIQADHNSSYTIEIANS